MLLYYFKSTIDQLGSQDIVCAERTSPNKFPTTMLNLCHADVGEIKLTMGVAMLSMIVPKTKLVNDV